MTPEQQRIACAELDGWRAEACYRIGGCLKNIDPDMSCKCDELNFDDMPDYLSDLNAVHALEEKLFVSLEQKDTFVVALCNLLNSDWDNWTDHDDFVLLHATAAQRVEAILRATGRWE